MKRALIFPGQGSQDVGMGKALYDSFEEAKEVFQEVDDCLDQHLSTLIFEGPLDELTLTENTQPALMATSLAVLRVLEKQGNLTIADITSFVAGHSLGEYSALAAAGSLTLADTAKLLKIRGKAMQASVPLGKGGMGVIIGLNIEEAQHIAEAAAQGDVCQVANDNSKGQVVLSGTIEAIKRAEPLAKEHGAKRFVFLNVSAPFHCALMAPAAEKMQAALAETHIGPPVVPLIANVTAESVTDPEAIRNLLVQQVTSVVRWRETLQYLETQNIAETVEIGAGKVLSGLTKRSCENIKTVSLGTPENIEAFITSL